jgi:hypothetical protein
MADRRGFQKERPKMKKRKQLDERKEARLRQKKEYETNDQVAISRLRTGYTRATHSPKMENVSNLLCQSIEHMLW